MNWIERIEKSVGKDSISTLKKKIDLVYKTSKTYPKASNMFRVFREVPYDDIKVVILGQDPYHNPGQANGLAFAVNENITLPSSLRNIFKEIESDLGKKPTDRTLIPWAEQGVFLLNTYLTVQENQPLSHKDIWEEFTDAVIKSIGNSDEPIVFILWGSKARKKKSLITKKHHLILESPHPSPLSANRGFFGCKHFSKTNQFLKDNDKQEIIWA